jgi:UDP-N-acetylglucosamine--N-acetylmuramyl-(pentapeptide) pyrophosphoryl-undecaprenol N-acetylglucosamine transferase
MSHFLISCGGTGGHLSPGIALAEGLTDRGHQATLIISEKKVDSRLSEKYPHLRFARMPGTGFSWRPAQLVRCAVSQLRALAFCRALIRSASPDAIVGFGGFTSVPVALAGRMAGLPVMLHESNRIPGLAIRLFGRFADRVYLPPGVRLASVRAAATRYVAPPVRREIVRTPRAVARTALGLDPAQKVLVLLGGSQGASALNQWARDQVASLADEGVQLYCVTGLGKGAAETIALKTKTGDATRAIFVPFSDRVAQLLSAADLVVSRAGAGSIAELIRCETPAILIPFPHAADDHQRANAAFFEREGGGIVLEQSGLGNLRAEVLNTLFNDWLLRKFRANLRRMDRANSLELMLRDLEVIAAGDTRTPTPSTPLAA